MQSKSEMKLLTVQEVANVFRVSISTIRRRVASARNGASKFPMPIFQKGHTLRFMADEITEYRENVPEIPHCPNNTSNKEAE